MLLFDEMQVLRMFSYVLVCDINKNVDTKFSAHDALL